jgi:TM2 domain-containing membrane protein YozV
MAATAPALAVSKPSWHYSIDGDTQGPVTTIDLRGLITSGQLCSMDLVWKEGMAGWAPAGDIDELQVSFDLQAATTSRTPATSGTGQERAGAGQHYCFACGSPADSRAEICPKCGVRQPGKSRSTKNRITAALFAFFLGGFGVHHFYLGNVVQGVVYLVFFWTLIPWFIAFIEGIIFLFTSDEQFGLRYPSPS